MPIFPFFNTRRKVEGAAADTADAERITAGGQIGRPGATVILTQPDRFDLDIADYIAAIRQAENVDYSRRVRLYDQYAEATFDPHVFSSVEKRNSWTLGKSISFINADGTVNQAVTAQIESPWFDRFVRDVLDANYWGFSLFQFFTDDHGWTDYFLVPRKHVDIDRQIIRRHQTDLHGVAWSEYPNLLYVAGQEPLGIYARILPYVIYKRGGFGDWAEFAEVFGIPMREYTYDANDEEARRKCLDDARQAGAAQVYVHPEGSSLQLHDASNKTGTVDVFEKLIERCDKQISKAILCNTLTTEADRTGTQALGTVHENVEQRLAKQDGKMLLHVLNYHMTDIFAALGIDTTGGQFVFMEQGLTTAEKMELFRTARRDLCLPIDDDYIYEQLGIEKPQDYEARKTRLEAEAAQARMETQAAGARNSAAGFFAGAPHAGASEW